MSHGKLEPQVLEAFKLLRNTEIVHWNDIVETIVTGLSAFFQRTENIRKDETWNEALLLLDRVAAHHAGSELGFNVINEQLYDLSRVSYETFGCYLSLVTMHCFE